MKSIFTRHTFYKAILCTTLFIVPRVVKSQTDTLQVFILAGQSNMSGRASADSLGQDSVDSEIKYYFNYDPIASPRTFANSNNQFTSLQPQLGTFGPEMGLGRTLTRATGQPIAMIKVSVGGTNLHTDWRKGENYLYEKMIREVSRALQVLADSQYSYRLAALCWMQGESDSRHREGSSQYETHLRQFIQNVRADLSIPDLPFIIARIKYKFANTYQEPVRWAQNRVASWDPYSTWIHTDDLTVFDGTHYDASSQLELGRRFARAYLQLSDNQASQIISSDVVVYGATPAGIAAAINAASQGVTVRLIEPTGHWGGMITGGMSNPDFKTFEAVGGFYREFMDGVVAHYEDKYGAESQQVEDCYKGVWYEPHVALSIFKKMLAEYHNLYIQDQHVLEQAILSDTASERVSLQALLIRHRGSGILKEVRAKVFIDATYEGDLMAQAGCAYRVGRESRSEYGELFAGVKYYNSGKFLPKSTGAADQKIQTFNFRLCMTQDPDNSYPIIKPDHYDRSTYTPLLALMHSGKITSVSEGIVRFRPIPNQKADVNDIMYSPFSLRLVGANYAWPDGTMETRQKIFERHKAYTVGLFYFLQNDPDVPDSIRHEAMQWGLPRHEFRETHHFPPILYVREARRLISDFVLTEHDTQPEGNSVRARSYADAVAICDYSLDSHGNGPEIPDYPGVTEGVFNRYVVPYQLPFRVMIPSRVEGLLVPVAVSASHVAFSSLRMEPTWTALGQAAGLAAALAVKKQTHVRNISVDTLQHLLHQRKALTVYVSDVSPSSPYFEAVQFWGTRGFFHHLPEYTDVSYIGRGKKGDLPGQYIEAYPYHDVHPQKPMEKSLAARWATSAGVNIAQVDYEGKSRGEFLQWLYEVVH